MRWLGLRVRGPLGVRPQRRLRILITNVGIANRTGTEVAAMDLAVGLARLGHAPMIWAPRLDVPVAEPALSAGIPVVSRFEELPSVPDVIHGHHHLETVAALEHFHGVPAIFVCHSGYWWHDVPPRHPQIRRYVAVDEFCRERLVQMPWIDSERIAVVLNSVDIARWPQRSHLPPLPSRALIFSNYAGRDTHLEPIDEACRAQGIALETLGSGSGRLSVEPERILPAYDLVFAKARCAIEAMASGCAVILSDTSGLGPMVSSVNARELRRWNFGFRVLQRPNTPELIAKEIQSYDARDARRVSNYIRTHAGLNDAVKQYVALYRAVLKDQQPDSDAVNWHPSTVPVEVDQNPMLTLHVLSLPEAAQPRQHFTFDVIVRNSSTALLATAAPWPSMLMYRWLDARTQHVVVEHGLRSIMQPPAWPGTETTYRMHAVAPSELGEYILRVTIIQEGWRWLDAVDPPVYCETRVSVGSELKR